jgi:hypothetical protein
MNIVNILKLRSVEIPVIPKILDNLYSCINFADTRYEILKEEHQLKKILDNDGYITVQFQGIAYLIFFCMIENKKCNILISKQQLKSDNKKNNIRDIKMFYMFLPFVNVKYYTGSIIDGKIIKSGKTSNAFIIHEFYYNEYQNVNMMKKYDIIKRDILPSFSAINKIEFKIARLYTKNDLPDLLFNKLPLSQSTVIGLMFLNTSTAPYHVYTNETEFNTIKVKGEIPITKNYDNSLTQFKMSDTKNPDVYSLYDMDDNTEVGIAHIPDIKTSHFFRNIFKNEKMIKVNCMKSEKFDKWIPLCNDCFDFSCELF